MPKKFTHIRKLTPRPDPRATSSSGVPSVDTVKRLFGQVGMELDPVAEMRIHLGGLQGKISDEVVATTLETLKGYSIEELEAIVEAGNELLWTNDPSYYTAVDQLLQKHGYQSPTALEIKTRKDELKAAQGRLTLTLDKSE